VSDPLRTVRTAHPSTPSGAPRETRLDDGPATEPYGHGATAGIDEEDTMARTTRATRPAADEPPPCYQGTHRLYWRAVLHRISTYAHVPCRVIRVDDDGWVTYEVGGERRVGWNHDPIGLRTESSRDRRNAHLLGADLITVGAHAYLLLDAPTPCSTEEPPTFRGRCEADGFEIEPLDDDDLWAD
jgi:hypothetical protein